MFNNIISFPLAMLLATTIESVLPPSSCFSVDYHGIITRESDYIASCELPSGAIIMGPNQKTIFQGSLHYKISPYFANFAAIALLDNPTSANIAIVNKWIQWYFSHINKDGTIYDYYADNLQGGAEHPSIDAYPAEIIPDFDSIDSYAATFLSLCRKYAEVSGNISLLQSNSYEIELVGNALVSVVDNSDHYYDMFSPDNNDGLTVAKKDHQAKYTMDNSEVNQGLKDMIWLQQGVSTYHNPSYYQTLLTNNTNGIEAHLWNGSDYYIYEGAQAINWNTSYVNALYQLYPVLFGVISPTSERAVSLYNTFNVNYPQWYTGTIYDASGYPWAIVSYAAALMNDQTSVTAYLSYLEFKGASHPDKWYIMESAFTILSAKKMLNLATSQ